MFSLLSMGTYFNVTEKYKEGHMGAFVTLKITA